MSKRIKARRMWSCDANKGFYASAHAAKDFFSAEDPKTVYCVAVINVSNPQSIIDHAADALSFESFHGERPTFEESARAVLESLRIISKPKKGCKK